MFKEKMVMILRLDMKINSNNEIVRKFQIEKYDKYEGLYYCDALHDDNEGFRIILEHESGQGPMLKVTFGKFLAYQNIDESNRLKFWNEQKDIDEKYTFYEVENSSWVKWFVNENKGKYESSEIKHYMILTGQDVIEVLSYDELQIEELF